MTDAWVKLAQGNAAILSNIPPVAVVTTTADKGTGVTASRHDHIHVVGADAVTGAKIADDAVGSEHIETLSAPLDVGQQQLQNVVLHKSATDPGTPAVGQVYYNTAENQIYLRVAG
jgi:hypothetical protein